MDSADWGQLESASASPLATVAALLPLLLSPTPVHLPAHLVSPTTAQSHHYLDSHPSDEAYWQPIKVQHEVTQLLQQLVQSHTGLDSLQPAAPRYAVDLLSVRSLVHFAPTPLAVILEWDSQSPTPAWSFLTLDSYNPSDDNQQWSATLELALKKAASKIKPAGASASDPKQMKIATPRAPVKSREDMAQGEGTTPGAYGDADDFWGGYSDEEDEQDSASGSAEVQQRDLHEVKENDYWDSYAGVESELAEESGGTLELNGVDPVVEQDQPDSTKPIINRSRRSSTIRPSLVPSYSPSTTPSDFIPTSTSTELPTPTPSVNGLKTTDVSGAAPATAREDREEESLRFALAGVWQLYAGAAGASKEKRDRWLRIASQVTQV